MVAQASQNGFVAPQSTVPHGPRIGGTRIPYTKDKTLGRIVQSGTGLCARSHCTLSKMGNIDKPCLSRENGGKDRQIGSDTNLYGHRCIYQTLLLETGRRSL